MDEYSEAIQKHEDILNNVKEAVNTQVDKLPKSMRLYIERQNELRVLRQAHDIGQPRNRSKSLMMFNKFKGEDEDFFTEYYPIIIKRLKPYGIKPSQGALKQAQNKKLQKFISAFIIIEKGLMSEKYKKPFLNAIFRSTNETNIKRSLISIIDKVYEPAQADGEKESASAYEEREKERVSVLDELMNLLEIKEGGRRKKRTRKKRRKKKKSRRKRRK